MPPPPASDSVSAWLPPSPAVPLTGPASVRRLPEAFVQVWLLPTITGTPMDRDPDDGAMEMPVPAGLPTLLLPAKIVNVEA